MSNRHACTHFYICFYIRAASDSTQAFEATRPITSGATWIALTVPLSIRSSFVSTPMVRLPEGSTSRAILIESDVAMSLFAAETARMMDFGLVMYLSGRENNNPARDKRARDRQTCARERERDRQTCARARERGTQARRHTYRAQWWKVRPRGGGLVSTVYGGGSFSGSNQTVPHLRMSCMIWASMSLG